MSTNNYIRSITVRVSEGTYMLLNDLARNEKTTISDVVRGLIQLAIDNMNTDKYYLIDKVNKLIADYENELNRLKTIKQQLEGEING
jgi:predicted DNA-binding protein